MDDHRTQIDWRAIQVSADWSYFLLDGQRLFEREFKAVLKFHAPGLAPVETDAGWSFIDTSGEAIIPGPFLKAWGFYGGLCAVQDGSGCYHILPDGTALYENRYAWCGNFQEGFCTVRSRSDEYFHINQNGERMYQENYRYAGDFKDGFASVMLHNGKFKHIDHEGLFIYEAEFLDLGVFHKGIATARDENGWMHIDLEGNALYEERYALLEPFYNGVAFVTDLNGQKVWKRLDKFLE